MDKIVDDAALTIPIKATHHSRCLINSRGQKKRKKDIMIPAPMIPYRWNTMKDEELSEGKKSTNELQVARCVLNRLCRRDRVALVATAGSYRLKSRPSP